MIPVLAALYLLLASSAAAIVINGTTVSGSRLTITGTGLSGTPLTVSLNGKQLTVVSDTATQIVATINLLPPPGTYRLFVKVGTPSATTYITLSNIVASVSLTDQTALIPETTLLTPTANALYRISFYMVQQLPQNPSCGNCGDLEANFQWTDDGGTHLMPSSTYPSTGIQLWNPCSGGVCQPSLEDGATPGLTFLARVNAGTPLTYSVTGTIESGVSYDVFVTVEQLM